ncbi:hypothetical protein X801_08067 [Opisthorchis viverrini]|uniref:Uncharacterized protein n=1 Tax=Opisthorchis viverrini TaxID=6198 RepID=A0A1S8WNZ9_OPIVI|nr:hypothetical protein X801_08067 [Opisthorchis viverrini]
MRSSFRNKEASAVDARSFMLISRRKKSYGEYYYHISSFTQGQGYFTSVKGLACSRAVGLPSAELASSDKPVDSVSPETCCKFWAGHK